MSGFHFLLEEHREAFDPYRALVVDKDPPLLRLVLSWGPAVVRQLHTEPLGNDLRDLWDCVEVDIQALVDLTGWGIPQVMSTLRQAQGLRLIWPDGSLSEPLALLLDNRYGL
jgi:hypothetical protein